MLASNVTPLIIYRIRSVCACSVGERLMTPLYTFVLPLPLWGLPQLMKSSYCFQPSSFLSSLHRLQHARRAAVRSCVTHRLCKFTSVSWDLALFLSVQTFTPLLNHSYRQRLCSSLRPPPLLIVELRKVSSCPPDSLASPLLLLLFSSVLSTCFFLILILA